MDLRDLKDRYGTKERIQLSSGQLRAVSSLTERGEDQHGGKMHSGWGACVVSEMMVPSSHLAKMVLEFRRKMWTEPVS